MARWSIRINDKFIDVENFREGRAVVVAKMVVFPGGHVMALTTKGKILSSRVRGVFAFGRYDNRVLGVLDGCAILGVLDKKEIEALRAEQERRRGVRDEKYHATNLADAAKSFGVKLPAAAERRIAAAKRAYANLDKPTAS